MTFAQWVRDARLSSGKKQVVLADAAKISQQDWSKIERLGVIPSDPELERICAVLGKTSEEALQIIDESATTDRRVQMYELDFLEFYNSLLERAAKQTRENPLRLFVIREDSEPIDSTLLQMHHSILTACNSLTLSFLFRYSDENIWNSFISLAIQLATRLRQDRDIDATQATEEVKTRLKGYYRTAQYEEPRSTSLPMAHPLVLISDSSGTNLYSYDFNPDVFESQKQAGLSEDVAQRNSIALLPGWKPKARLIAGWIGPLAFGGPTNDKWKEIEW